MSEWIEITKNMILYKWTPMKIKLKNGDIVEAFMDNCDDFWSDDGKEEFFPRDEVTHYKMTGE